MKKILFALGLFLTAVTVQSQEYLDMIDAGTYPVQQIIDNAESYFENKDKGRGSGYKQFKRWEYNAVRLMNENGYLPSITDRLQTLDDYNAYLNQTAENRQVLNDNWQDKGPFAWNQGTAWSPGVGRVTGIAVDASNSDHIIIGANTGGVWRTVDGGQNWTPTSDNFSNLYVYSVAMDPNNSDTYFFGSNSGLIFKSIDTGATWNLLGDAGSSIVNKILINPNDTDLMFATKQQGGISKSTDGGVTWTQAVSDNRGTDVEFKPGDPTVVYASGQGFHKSTDSGQSFTTIGGFTNGYKMIGVSAADVDRVYVVEEDSGSFGAIYSSANGGDSFTELDHAGRSYFGYDQNGVNPGGQAPRDMDIAVNPTDADEVFIAGVHTWRSGDAGVSFQLTADWIPQQAAQDNRGYHHADVDILLFDGTTLFVGSDGGIFKAENTGTINANFYEDITDGLGIRQFYKIGVAQTSDLLVTGGSQDNGSSFLSDGNVWEDWIGADGMEGFVDKDEPNRMYGMIQFGAMYRTENGGNSLINISEPSPGGGNWVSPFEQDPADLITIYLGYNAVHKSTNRGIGWTKISQTFGGNLTNLKIAASNNQIMYASRSNTIYKTVDGGATDWTNITNPGGIVNFIAIHPTNPNLIAVATTSTSRVYVSDDGGATWQNYKKNLPGFSALSLIWDANNKEGLYLGMDYGVYYIDNTLTDWQPYSNNLPNVIINELEINNTTNMLYAGTYGRGLWESPLVDDAILGVNDRLTASDVTVFPNPSSTEVTISLPQNLEVDIRVFDISGKLMIYQRDVLVENSHTMNVSALTNGVYFIRMNSAAGTITKKLIKK